jgi:hypothetical protein
MHNAVRLRTLTAFCALAGLSALSACTAAGEPASASAQSDGRQCFRADQVNGFNAIDDDTVDVSVGASRVYRLELFGPCPDVDWSQRIGIRARGGSNWVCRGIDAELIVPSAIGPSQCQVSSIRRLSEEEMDADREARRRD